MTYRAVLVLLVGMCGAGCDGSTGHARGEPGGNDSAIGDAQTAIDGSSVTRDADANAVDGAKLGPIVLGSNVQLLPVGDSITGEPRTYRTPLYKSLSAHGCVVDYVGSETDAYSFIDPEKQHEGHPGYNTADVLRDMNAWFSSTAFKTSAAGGKAPAPQIALLMIGTNNFAWNGCHDDSGAQAVDANLQIVDRIVSAHPNVWLIDATSPPMGNDASQSARCFNAAADYNAGLRSRVGERAQAGKRISLLDMNARLTASDLRDTVHPTDSGYAKMARAWLSALAPLLSCLENTTCTNGVKDGDEKAADCGGRCPDCS